MTSLKTNFHSISSSTGRAISLLLFWVTLVTFYSTPPALSMVSTAEDGFYYSRHFEDGLSIDEYLLIIPEKGQRFSFEAVRSFPDSLFYTLKDQPFLFGEAVNFWFRLRITNDTDERRTDYIAPAISFDTVEVYSIKAGFANFEMKTGFNIPPELKRVPDRRSFVNFELDPGQTIEFYMRGSLRDVESQKHALNFFIFEDFYSAYRHVFFQNLIRIFLASILFLFALFSLVMFFSFKENIFFIYSMLMLLLTFYFLDYQNIIDYLFFLPAVFRGYFSNSILVAGVIILSYLFISLFLNLKKWMPRFNRLFFALAIIIFLLSIFRSFIFSPYDPTGRNILNSFLLFFLVLCFVAILLLSLKGIKQAKILLISMFFMFFGAFVFILSLLEILPVNDFTSNSFQWGVVAFSGTLFYGLFDKIKSIQKDKIQIRVEKEKTDELLFNILPSEVATELKEKGFCEARDYSKVHVMFTDFKDFTATSSQLSAKELVYEVNSCFVAFDQIIEKFKVEKIKTIGDSYMAASGLETQTEARVKDIVLAALEMQEFLNKRKEEHLNRDHDAFEMRVGIHTGPVVAGIVGVKKFQYDIWGDTVNTASRVEEHGEVGKVNISDTTYQSIKDDPDFAFEKREEIEVKGKGKLSMWFVSKSSIVEKA